MKEEQSKRPVMTCMNKKLENLFTFKYLDTVFTADGLQCYDIKKRIVLTMTRCDRLRHTFGSPCITLHLKLRLYEAVASAQSSLMVVKRVFY